jgi:hypothetical protein
VDDVLSHWSDHPNHRGGMHDTIMWNYVVNAWMHCIDVAMGIGILIAILISNKLLHYKNPMVLKICNDG